MFRREQPAEGQESVWDYPRPPRVEDSTQHIQIAFNGEIIADTYAAKRVLETSHPPSYYIPPEGIKREFFSRTARSSFCEFKGNASYYTISVGGKTAPNAAWFYPKPSPGYEAITNYVAVYPGRMEACFVDGELVVAQEGDFYGGWITKAIVGPFKGGSGTVGW